MILKYEKQIQLAFHECVRESVSMDKMATQFSERVLPARLGSNTP